MTFLIFRRALISRYYETYKEKKKNKVVSINLVGLQEQACPQDLPYVKK
jgi:hypothetical protein